ncbi:MAG TPA: hypothetical protein VFN30_06910 [Chitinophagaceae bacterium]|nr:hypothetical protein [Chitinophagaceae bacterium]
MKCLNKSLFFLLMLMMVSVSSLYPQRVVYAEPDRDDFRQMQFEILGKMKGNFLIYKNYRNRHFIAVYDNDMKQKAKEELTFMPDRTINEDFISYNDYSLLIYQYQKRGVVYCMGVKIGADGKKTGEPIELDTTQIGVFGDNKIYTTVFSEDKQKVMVFKIKGKNKDNLTITTMLFDPQFQLQNRRRWAYTIDEHNDIINDFAVTNNGDFAFLQGHGNFNRDNISQCKLVVKKLTDSMPVVTELPFKDIYLDEVRLKIDNYNKRYVVTSFYSRKKRDNIAGLYSVILNWELNDPVSASQIEFSDELRKLAKGDVNSKAAFNDYFIKHIIIKGDGGFVLTSESNYTSSRGTSWNRWDYLYGNPFYSPFDYYAWSPWNNWGWGWNRFNNLQSIRYYADNIMVLSLDNTGKLQWSSIINKSQFDDDTDNLLSYQLMNLGGELHFLYNEWQRRTPILLAQAVGPDGKLSRIPPFKNMDRGYDVLIRLSKQVSAKQLIAPCIYRNYISFAKVEFL